MIRNLIQSEMMRLAVEFEVALNAASATIGEEEAQRCIDWARTTAMPNSEAAQMCWRAGGVDRLENYLYQGILYNPEVL